MATWSGIRKKLEEEYLAQSLRGRVQYFCTTYRKSHDHEGRAAILVDGREVLQGNYYNSYLKSYLLPKEEKYSPRKLFLDVDAVTVGLGMFEQHTFYNAFREFDNQSIEDSLQSGNFLIRIFAVLDRRVGKRRLAAMVEQMMQENSILRDFFCLRLEAEGMEPRKDFTEK